MTLDNKTTEKIKALVYSRPRNINEIAHAINKNWRTADRYIDQIMLQTGTIKTITFREGTRGALKIVYWNNTEKIYSTDVQEKLFKQIESVIDKADFSPFEIYQYIDPKNRKGYYEEIESEKDYNYNIKSLAPFFEVAQKEIYIFAGNLAFLHLKHNKQTIFEYIKEAVKRKVIIKIITDINLADLRNVEQVLSLNSGLREPSVEVRHEQIPLRAYIFDNTIIKLGEINSSQRKKGQKKQILALYYVIRDESWIDWMQKLFYKKFQNAIPSNIRIENLRSISKL